MNKLRFIFKLLIAYFSRFKLIIISSILLGIILFFIINTIISKSLEIRIQKIGIVGRYTSDNLPEEISNILTRKLVTLSEDGTPRPDLAYEWETPDKGKTWNFKIGDFFWQDGTPITSNSIKIAFEGVNIKTSDPKTITFELQENFVPFPNALARPVFKKGLLGTENWKIKKINFAGNYIKQIEIINEEAKSVKIYKFYPTLEQAKIAFKLGKVDELHDVTDPSPFDKWNVVQVFRKLNKKQIVIIFFNTKDEKLKDKSLRQALSYAIDKEKLGERAISPISPDSWAYNSRVKPYDYDPNRSKEIIDEMPLEIKNNLSIKLVTFPSLLQTAELIAKDWHQIGIETTVQISSIAPTDFQAFLAIYNIPTDPDQYALWHSTQIETNISKYSNPRIDKLLEDGRITIDIQERKRIYLDFQRFLLEDAPCVFLYHPVYYNIVRKKV